MVACMKLFPWAILALALAGCARSGAPAPVVDRTLTYDGIFAVASKAAASVGERVADSVARVVQEVKVAPAPPSVAAPRPTVIVEDIDIAVAAQPDAATGLSAAAPKSVAVSSTQLSGSPAGTYRVAKGDTVYAIARRQGVDAKTIMALNDLAPPYTLRIGDRIRVPASASIISNDNVGLAAAPPIPATAIAVPKASTRPLPQTPSSVPVILASAGPAPKLRPQPPRRLAAASGPVGLPPARSGGGFAWPVKGPVLAAYGALDGGRFNDGLNIGAPRGTPVIAAENGVVVYAGNEIRGFGNLVLLKHDGGIITAYAHNDALLVRRGDMVGKGDQIARVGRSGGVAEPQLHFEIRRGTQAVDPNTLLAQQELAAR